MNRLCRFAAVGTVAFSAGCQLAGPGEAPAPGGVPGLPAEEPTVRVGLLVDTMAVVVSASEPFDILAEGEIVAVGAGGESWVPTADESGALWLESVSGERSGPYAEPIRFVPQGDAPIEVSGDRYRGEVLVVASGEGRVTAINVVGLERYLLGVVPAEMPAIELEALKAQAVAARTYAVSHLGGRADIGFDFFDTVSDQVYAGVASEHPMTTRAVRETRGEILVYAGEPILAFFHSTCGGRTAAIEEVWSSDPIAYLRSVSDRIPGTDDYYCEASNRFRWTERWTGGGLAGILEKTLAEHLGHSIDPIAAVRNLEVTERTEPSELRAQLLRIELEDGREYEVRGDSIRWVLSPEPDRILNSTLFHLEVEHGNDDGVRAVGMDGGGWGHGIGMCQFGAIGRAKAGHDYRRILAAYYVETRLTRLY